MRAELTVLASRSCGRPPMWTRPWPSRRTMIVVNSVCGCAAGKARPGVAMALQHDRGRISSPPCSPAPTSRRPTRAQLLAPYPPSSPSVAIAARRQAGVHAAAARHREPRRAADRRPSHGGVRSVLRAARAMRSSGDQDCAAQVSSSRGITRLACASRGAGRAAARSDRNELASDRRAASRSSAPRSRARHPHCANDAPPGRRRRRRRAAAPRRSMPRAA